MHLVLTGATGLVGAACLHAALNAKNVTKISIISRRPVPMAEGHDQVKVIINKDFANFDSTILEQLKGAHGVIWASGPSANDVSKDVYIKTTLDQPVAFAKALSAANPEPMNFVYVSGEGATTTPGMLTPLFGRIKGQCEAALLAFHKTTPAFKVYSARPAAVDPLHHPEIHPFIPQKKGLAKAVTAAVLPAIRASLKSRLSPTEHLGKVLVDLAMSGGDPLTGIGIEGEGRTISNVGLRRLAGI